MRGDLQVTAQAVVLGSFPPGPRMPMESLGVREPLPTAAPCKCRGQGWLPEEVLSQLGLGETKLPGGQQ